MRAILAVDDEGSTAASRLREEGIDVVAVVSADTPARAAAVVVLSGLANSP